MPLDKFTRLRRDRDDYRKRQAINREIAELEEERERHLVIPPVPSPSLMVEMLLELDERLRKLEDSP